MSRVPRMVNASNQKKVADRTRANRAELERAIEELHSILERIDAGEAITGALRDNVKSQLETYYLMLSVKYFKGAPGRRRAEKWRCADLALELMNRGARSKKAAASAAISAAYPDIDRFSRSTFNDLVVRAMNELESGRKTRDSTWNASIIEEAMRLLR